MKILIKKFSPPSLLGPNTFLNIPFSNTLSYSAGLRAGDWGFESRWGLGIFLITASRTALEPIQPPIRWVPGSLTLRVKRPEREADHSFPSSADVKNAWNYISAHPIRLHGVVLS